MPYLFPTALDTEHVEQRNGARFGFPDLPCCHVFSVFLGKASESPLGLVILGTSRAVARVHNLLLQVAGASGSGLSVPPVLFFSRARRNSHAAKAWGITTLPITIIIAVAVTISIWCYRKDGHRQEYKAAGAAA